MSLSDQASGRLASVSAPMNVIFPEGVGRAESNCKICRLKDPKRQLRECFDMRTSKYCINAVAHNVTRVHAFASRSFGADTYASLMANF